MFSILSNIFRKRISLMSFLLSALGLCIGLTLVLFSLRLYVGIVAPAQAEIRKSDYVLISKDISLGNTIFQSKAKFSSGEISDMKEQKFSASLAPFISSQFQVKAYAGGGIPFMTDLFFESIPNGFIDNCPGNFRWSEGDDFLPILVSEDFINLYNYTFALQNGLPQVSPATISTIPLRIKMKGPRGEREMKGRIVGFSERIASVLVPDNFLRWANKEIGGVSKDPDVSRLVIRVNKEYAVNLQEFIKEKGYYVNSERLMQSKVSATANILTQILVALGGLFILFSFVIVLQNFSLILSEARQDMILLLQLGYKISTIVRFLFFVLLAYVLSVAAISTVVYVVLYGVLTRYLQHRNLQSGSAVTTEVVLSLAAVSALLLVTSLWSISNKVKKYN